MVMADDGESAFSWGQYPLSTMIMRVYPSSTLAGYLGLIQGNHCQLLRGVIVSTWRDGSTKLQIVAAHKSWWNPLFTVVATLPRECWIIIWTHLWQYAGRIRAYQLPYCSLIISWVWTESGLYSPTYEPLTKPYPWTPHSLPMNQAGIPTNPFPWRVRHMGSQTVIPRRLELEPGISTPDEHCRLSKRVFKPCNQWLCVKP